MMSDKQIKIEKLLKQQKDESLEIKNLEKFLIKTNKRIKELTRKEKELNKELHFLITGNAPK